MINNVTLMGRLTADPELRTTQNGKEVVSCTVAVDRDYGDKQADFISVVAWEKTAQFISKYFHKGSMIALCGSIRTRAYEDKNGNKRTATEVWADKISFCGEKKAATNQPDIQPSSPEVDDEDLPF